MMNAKATQLRKLLDRTEVVRVAGAHNALGAKLAVEVGFDAVWASGLEITACHCVPDANILPMTEFLQAATSMNEAVPAPIIADCDTGFGTANNVIHMVRRYEAAGIAAVCIEDKKTPKVNSLLAARQELAPVSEFVGKIMAAKNAQVSTDFMVIARVEALIAGLGVDAALERAHAYANAGADAILIHSKSRSADQVGEFCHRWDAGVPLVAVPTTYNHVTADELASWGVKIVIHANHGIRAAVPAMRRVFQRILAEGRSSGVEEEIAPLSVVFELQGMPQLKEWERRYLRTGREAVTAIIPAAGAHLDEKLMGAMLADRPICLLDINGKTLLERQVETLTSLGVQDIVVVAGYKHEAIDMPGIQVVVNHEFEATGILHSIRCGFDAVPESSGVLLAYADVYFERSVLRALLERREDIVLVVDSGFAQRTYGASKRVSYCRCDPPPTTDARQLGTDSVSRLTAIGPQVTADEAHVEFTGIMLLSADGFARVRNAYQEALVDAPFDTRTEDLELLLQLMLDAGDELHCLHVNSGWTEVHSFEDYRRACAQIR